MTGAGRRDGAGTGASSDSTTSVPATAACLEAEDKPVAEEALQQGIEVFAGLQKMLYAQDRWAVLLPAPG